MARNERKNYYVKLTGKGSDSRKIPFRSPYALYDSIKETLGVKDVKESDYILASDYGSAGKILPRLRLKFENTFLNNGLGNQAQADGTSNALVFCDPGQIETALWKLKGKTARGKRIADVRIPKRIAYI